MKNLSATKLLHSCISVAAIGAAFSIGSASAQVYTPPIYVGTSANDLGFYFNGDLGPSFVSDFQSSRFGFPADFSTHPGVRFDVEPGYNFVASEKLTLGGEFETGTVYNKFSNITSDGLGTSLRVELYQVPILGNLVLKLHPDDFVVPYIGVGGGGDYSNARFHSPGFFGFETHDDEIDPAVQAMAGVRFRINYNIDLGLGYKYLAAFPYEGTSIQTHSVSATVSFRF